MKNQYWKVHQWQTSLSFRWKGTKIQAGAGDPGADDLNVVTQLDKLGHMNSPDGIIQNKQTPLASCSISIILFRIFNWFCHQNYEVAEHIPELLLM
jgi:hypothetical protein